MTPTQSTLMILNLKEKCRLFSIIVKSECLYSIHSMMTLCKRERGGLNSRNDKLSVDEFHAGLRTLCPPESIMKIFELVKLHCPIEKYSDIEQFLLTSAL